jgi:hypothetical protein
MLKASTLVWVNETECRYSKIAEFITVSRPVFCGKKQLIHPFDNCGNRGKPFPWISAVTKECGFRGKLVICSEVSIF